MLRKTFTTSDATNMLKATLFDLMAEEGQMCDTMPLSELLSKANTIARAGKWDELEQTMYDNGMTLVDAIEAMKGVL